MDFQNRQYDPQIGRFLSIDPLADDDQEEWSPYAAMGNNPAMMVDPLGLKFDMKALDNSNNASPVYDMGGRKDNRPGASVGFEAWLAASITEALQMKNERDAKELLGSLRVPKVGIGIVILNDMTCNYAGEGSGGGGGSETVDGIAVRDYPSSGTFRENGVTYDLGSFDQFFKDNEKKYEARYLDVNGNIVSLKADAYDILVDGKPGKWYAEVGSQLSIDPTESVRNHSLFVTVGKNRNYRRSGTSYMANKVSFDDMYVPSNSVDATIHIHNTPGVGIIYAKKRSIQILPSCRF